MCNARSQPSVDCVLLTQRLHLEVDRAAATLGFVCWQTKNILFGASMLRV